MGKKGERVGDSGGDLRDSVSDGIVGADHVDEGCEERENVTVLRGREVGQPSIGTTHLYRGRGKCYLTQHNCNAST